MAGNVPGFAVGFFSICLLYTSIQHTEAVMYRTVSNDFAADEAFDYDMLVFFSPAAVSYTHLDVYKRQAGMWSMRTESRNYC